MKTLLSTIYTKLLVGLLAGSILGTLASRYVFVGSALSLIPWGIVGLLLGMWSAHWKESALVGLVYGFALAFVFTLTGYQGAAPMLSRLPFFLILGIIGALCGIVLGVIGSFIRTMARNFPVHT